MEIEKIYKYQIKPTLGRKALIFSCSDYYCKYLETALQSLFKHTKASEKYDLIIIENNISQEKQNIIKNMVPTNFNLSFYTIATIAQELALDFSKLNSGKWDISTFYKVLIPFFTYEYEKTAYFDSDILFNSSISELLNIEFDNYELLAVKDEFSQCLHSNPERHRYLIETLNLENPHLYFNAGVMIFNNKQINLENYLNRIQEAFKITPLLFVDQEIFNMVFQGKVKFIPTKWNVPYHVLTNLEQYRKILNEEYLAEILSYAPTPAIIHYTGSRKPWIFPEMILSEYFWQSCRLTPSYEKIIYENILRREENTIKKHLTDEIKRIQTHQDYINTLLVNKYKIFLLYIKYKILSQITLGKKRKKYTEKRNHYKTRVNDIRKFSRL